MKVTIHVINPVAKVLLSKDRPHRPTIIPNKKKKNARVRVDVRSESW